METYLSLGLELISLDKVLLFEESAFMKEWVQACTQGRIKASEEGDLIKKSFYKIIVNSVFG